MWDPLGHSVPLPLEERFFPRGFPLVLRTNAAEVLAAGRHGWGEFGELFPTAPLELRVVVHDGERDLRAGAVVQAQGHLLANILDPKNFVVCDLERGFGFASLSSAVARDLVFTSFHFLDCMAYSCLCQRYVTPVHAACVARNGRGVLLVGETGAGKSSLAWACARAGLTYVADDATWLLRASDEPVLLGKPQRMRFRPESVRLIPELANLSRLENVIGKDAFEIRTAQIPWMTTAECCRAWRTLFLDRRENGDAVLYPMGAEETFARLQEARPIYEARVQQEQEASIRRMLGCPAFVLRYSTLTAAVEQILKLE